MSCRCRRNGRWRLPQALPFADDRSGVSAVDLTAQEAVGERNDLRRARKSLLRRRSAATLIERRFVAIVADGVEQAEKHRSQIADPGMERLVEVPGNGLLVGIEAAHREIDRDPQDDVKGIGIEQRRGKAGLASRPRPLSVVPLRDVKMVKVCGPLGGRLMRLTATLPASSAVSETTIWSDVPPAPSMSTAKMPVLVCTNWRPRSECARWCRDHPARLCLRW